jgi:hypothetical protein
VPKKSSRGSAKKKLKGECKKKSSRGSAKNNKKGSRRIAEGCRGSRGNALKEDARQGGEQIKGSRGVQQQKRLKGECNNNKKGSKGSAGLFVWIRSQAQTYVPIACIWWCVGIRVEPL